MFDDCNLTSDAKKVPCRDEDNLRLSEARVGGVEGMAEERGKNFGGVGVATFGGGVEGEKKEWSAGGRAAAAVAESADGGEN